MRFRDIVPTAITKEQAKDTGMAMVLILLMISLTSQNTFYTKVGIVAVLITMTVPKVLSPLGKLWFGLANLLGIVVPKVLLSLVFFVVVTPIGLLRRLMRIDTLQLKIFKKGADSVMFDRSHLYSNVDIEKPY